MINVTKTYLPDIKKYQRYVERIFNNGWITNKGELVQELEGRLCDYLGVENVILVANGSLGLQVAYKALGLQGAVITSPFSFVATVSTLVWENLTPVFADIDSNTLNVLPENIDSVWSDVVSAVVPVHVFGNPCDCERIDALAKARNVRVIYDAAHAFGVREKGKSILRFGDVSVLSFHATKLFHTIEGGALITDDAELAKEIRLLINFGISGETSIEGLGTNAKMNEFEAAMGLAILEDMDDILASRQRVSEAYGNSLSGVVEIPEVKSSVTRNYAYAPILLKSEEERCSVEQRLLVGGVKPRRYFYPSLNTLPYLPKSASCPVSESAADRILCLPMYPGLDKEIPIDNIAECVKQGLLP